MKGIFFLGRLLFSAIFMIKSLEHFSPTMIEHATSMGVPMAQLIVPISGIIAFVGGLSILLGYKAKAGAWLLVIFLIPTTFVMHNFWQEAASPTAMMQNFCFWKNIALLGTALMLTYTGAGPLSLEKKNT